MGYFKGKTVQLTAHFKERALQRFGIRGPKVLGGWIDTLIRDGEVLRRSDGSFSLSDGNIIFVFGEQGKAIKLITCYPVDKDSGSDSEKFSNDIFYKNVVQDLKKRRQKVDRWHSTFMATKLNELSSLYFKHGRTSRFDYFEKQSSKIVNINKEISAHKIEYRQKIAVLDHFLNK